MSESFIDSSWDSDKRRLVFSSETTAPQVRTAAAASGPKSFLDSTSGKPNSAENETGSAVLKILVSLEPATTRFLPGPQSHIVSYADTIRAVIGLTKGG